jgi:hypothetical protein
MISRFLKWMGDFFSNLTSVIFEFLGNLFGYLFQQIINFLRMLFSPILIVIAALFYFVYQLGVLVFTLLKVIYGIAMIFVSLIKGIIATLIGFTWTSTPQNHGQWSNIFGNLSQGMENYQLANLSYVLMFIIWFATAFAAIRIISSMSGGGEE